MAPTFNRTSSKVTVSATIPATVNGIPVREGDVRWALQQTARDNGVTLGDLTVTVEPGDETVTLTRAEYDALRASNTDA